MRRKMLISIVLIFSILLQCVVPLFSVQASTGYSITLDSDELYTAVKNSLTSQGISATYSSSENTITISEEEFENITYLDLSNSGIDDLTGLSQFTNVTSLNLTANELTVDSNLSELDSLPLEKLNLSSNKLESVSSITTFYSIDETDITNQEVTTKEIISVDVSEDSNYTKKYTITLPDILLEDTGSIDADWIDATVDGDAVVNWGTISGNTLTLTVASGSGDSYVALSGLVTISISVDDSTSKLANTKMTLYYIITDSDHTGIIFEDENFYNAVKEQLTSGQTENEELISYGDDGETLYEAYYDDCLILVIENNTLFNNITSLVLNDKKIKDLTGLEEFVGLSTDLNLSYNYIDSIEKLIELDENKDEGELELQEKYEKYIEILEEFVTEYQSYKSEKESLEEELESLEDELEELENSTNSSADSIASKEEEISECQLSIAECEAKMDTYYEYISETMTILYDIYENEYLLTGIVPCEIAILSLDDFEEASSDELESYVNSIISYISTLEQAGALSEWETEILIETYDIPTTISTTDDDDETITEEIENPISEYFSDWLEGSDLYSWSTWYNFIYEIRQINDVIIAGNECELEQLYNEQEDCSYEEAFSILISDLYSICLDTTFAEITATTYETYSSTCMSESSTDEEKIVAIATKLVNASSDVTTYVKLPRLKNLNLEDNSIESLAGLEAFEELETLNAYKNLLDDVSDVDWSVFTNLSELNLGYNQLSDISCLEVLNLTKLNLSNNLLSGSFDFYLAGMSNLESADFSGNQISNISYYINQYKFLAKAAGMDIEDYLLSESSPTVSFQYQVLSMSTTVVLSGSFITIDLPSIFEQAEEIDNTRTSFGIDSLQGTVSSDGTTVKLYTPSTGTRTAVVTIDGYSGTSYSTEGIAYGTTCTIEYSIVESLEEDEEDETEDDTDEEDVTDTEDTDSTDVEDTTNTDSTDVEDTTDTDSTDTTTDDTTDTDGADTTTDDTTDTDGTDTTTDDTESSDTETAELEYGYTVEDGYVIVNTPEITVSEFADSLVTTSGYTVTVVNSSDAIDDYLATGAVVSVDTDDGEEVAILEIVVLGDVNGDGEVDALDSGIVKNVINDTTSLVGVYYEAADVNRDGDIDKLDSALILQFRADKISSF